MDVTFLSVFCLISKISDRVVVTGKGDKLLNALLANIILKK